MIRAHPKSMFSWNFSLEGAGIRGETRVNFFSENGEIVLNGEVYQVEKQGMMSGSWHLLRQGEVLVKAKKQSAMSRKTLFSAGAETVELRGESLVGRAMLLEGGGVGIRIAPDHPFTRKSTISEAGPNPPLTLFAFWVAVLLWKRASDSRNSS